jgi:tetratricopeptide (TPR) repeat protein
MSHPSKIDLVRQIPGRYGRGWGRWIPICLCLAIGGIVLRASPSDVINEALPDLDLAPSIDPGVSNAPVAPPPQNTTPITASTAASLPATGLTNASEATATAATAAIDPFQRKLEAARYLRKTRQFDEAQQALVALLGDNSPETIQKSALLELAAMAQDQDDLPRAQDIYAQFLNRWPDDPRTPEILLRQGQIFREMGLSEMALNKFYAVMTTALVLKDSQLELYKHLVLQAQIAIANTHYDLGKYAEAAEFFSRLYKQNNPSLDKPQILSKLVYCYDYTSNYDLVVADGQSFLTHYPGAPEEPEVRFDLAQAFNQLGRHNDALLQVLDLLKGQSRQAATDPSAWAYWRQRAGNLIGNQLYQSGDYTRALDIYTSLAQLDASPEWQVPVWYQMGLTYEHLWQPQKAADLYHQIISREQQLGTNASPNLATIANMAQWRINFMQWQNHAENVNHDLHQLNAAIAELQPATNSPP